MKRYPSIIIDFDIFIENESFKLADFFDEFRSLLNDYGQKRLLECSILISVSRPKKKRSKVQSLPILEKKKKILISVLKDYSNNLNLIEYTGHCTSAFSEYKLCETKHILIVSDKIQFAAFISQKWNLLCNGEIYDLRKFKKRFSFLPNPHRLRLYKILAGNNNENIEPAIPNLPKEILVDIVQRFSSETQLFQDLWRTNYPEIWKKAIHAFTNQIKINGSLIDRSYTHNKTLRIVSCERSSEKARIWFDLWGLQKEPWMLPPKNEIFFKAKKGKRS